MFLSHRLQNQADSDKILYLLSWIYLPQSTINVFHLTQIMRLHYFVKLKIHVFCENSNAEKVKLNKFYLSVLILLIEKGATSRYRKFNQEKMYQTLLESTSFCKRYDKNILVCFSVYSSNCCSLVKTRLLSFIAKAVVAV